MAEMIPLRGFAAIENIHSLARGLRICFKAWTEAVCFLSTQSGGHIFILLALFNLARVLVVDFINNLRWIKIEGFGVNVRKNRSATLPNN